MVEFTELSDTIEWPRENLARVDVGRLANGRGPWQSVELPVRLVDLPASDLEDLLLNEVGIINISNIEDGHMLIR